MATRFELVLHGDDPTRLRAAGEEALAEIEHIESQLSLYRTDSELSWINAHAGRERVPVEPRLFRLLQLCTRLSDLTDGAFDVTVTPLTRCWGFVGGTGHIPTPAELDAARAVTGMHHVELDEDGSTVRFDREGVELDLGAIGWERIRNRTCGGYAKGTWHCERTDPRRDEYNLRHRRDAGSGGMAGRGPRPC